MKFYLYKLYLRISKVIYKLITKNKSIDIKTKHIKDLVDLDNKTEQYRSYIIYQAEKSFSLSSWSLVHYIGTGL